MRYSDRFRPLTRRRGAGGFTLIEMLLVVSLIVLLISMLLPALRFARGTAKKTACESNVGALMKAYRTYAFANSRRLVGSNTTRAWDWVGAGNTEAAIQNRPFFEYVGGLNSYQCPDHVYPRYLNSYALNGMLGGEQESWYKGNKSHITTDMRDGEQLVLFEEDDNRGYNINSWMLPLEDGKFIDLPAANHNGGDNLGYLDGHVEYWEWQSKSMRRRPKHINGGPSFGHNEPGNPDHAALRPYFRTWPK